MEDLDAAKLDDVKDWFQTYYGPANAVLVVAGDIDAKTAHEKVEQYFGDIPSGPPVASQGAWTAKRTGSQRGVMQDRVPRRACTRCGTCPPGAPRTPTTSSWRASVLSDGKSSRLYKRLVYGEQIATDVDASLDLREIGGLFTIEAGVRPGHDPAKVESAMEEELARFLAGGPTAVELQRAKTRTRAGFIRGVERIGGFGGKSDVLAKGEVFAGRPDFYKTQLARVAGATAAQVRRPRDAGSRDGDYTLEFGRSPTSGIGASADRSKLPEPGAPPEAEFPALERTTLSNGLKVILAERRSIPRCSFDLLLDAGYAADQFAEPGTASLAMSMLDEGTRPYGARDQRPPRGPGRQPRHRLGARRVERDARALRERLDPALALYADVVLHPAFRQADFERLQKQRLARSSARRPTPWAWRSASSPGWCTARAMRTPIPWTGSGHRGVDREDHPGRPGQVPPDLVQAQPRHAGRRGRHDDGRDRPKLERLFAGWQPGDVPRRTSPPVPRSAKPEVYLLDRPGALQTVLIAGNVAPPKANPTRSAIETMSAVLGGDFGSRLNMNLREDKHWSYGAFSFIRDARGPRAVHRVRAGADRQDPGGDRRAAEGAAGHRRPRPVEPDELERAKASLTLTLPGSWETMGAVAAPSAKSSRSGSTTATSTPTPTRCGPRPPPGDRRRGKRCSRTTWSG